MKLYATLYFLMLVFCASAQEYEYVPFPTENAVWEVDKHSSVDCGSAPGYCERLTYAVIGESTTLENTEYQLMQFHNGIGFDPIYASREDTVERKIYLASSCETGFECVAYDFGMIEGDTLYPPITMGGGGGYFHTIGSIDTVQLLDGTLRKKFSLLDYGILDNGNFWIEGIGGHNGPFQLYNQPERWSWLRCYSFNDELTYSNQPNTPPEYFLMQYPEYIYCDPNVVGLEVADDGNHIVSVYPKGETWEAMGSMLSSIQTGAFGTPVPSSSVS